MYVCTYMIVILQECALDKGFLVPMNQEKQQHLQGHSSAEMLGIREKLKKYVLLQEVIYFLYGEFHALCLIVK